MTKKRFIFVGIIFAGIIIIIGFYLYARKSHLEKEEPKKGMVLVEPVPFQTKTGWGYNIIANHKIYFHQEFIPAIQGYKPFSSREDALKAANLVISKISMGKLPTLTVKEIDSLQIVH